jgi:hypothetical protein
MDVNAPEPRVNGSLIGRIKMEKRTTNFAMPDDCHNYLFTASEACDVVTFPDTVLQGSVVTLLNDADQELTVEFSGLKGVAVDGLQIGECLTAVKLDATNWCVISRMLQ